jgi:hypothetical protein
MQGGRFVQAKVGLASARMLEAVWFKVCPPGGAVMVATGRIAVVRVVDFQ